MWMLLFVLIVFACASPSHVVPDEGPLSLIPRPVSVSVNPGAFVLDDDTVIYTSLDIEPEAEKFSRMIAQATGFSLEVKPMSSFAEKGIFLSTDPELCKSSSAEAYDLKVTEDAVVINAGGAAGAFYAFQTMRQLLPCEVFGTGEAEDMKWTMPCCVIEDCPRFGWRGLHLDVSRHFFDAGFVKRYIDLLAMHKMNRFHWHLVDGQGWRIEIKKHPKLTKIGAWRTGFDGKNWNYRDMRFPGKGSDEKLYGGYYTQEEIRDVVAYAKERHVEILPEIEMPGHSWCALIAHPELTCTQTVPGPDGHHGQNVFCAGKEETFAFLEEILDEVIALFPFEYVHVGGDEVNKKFWESCDDCKRRMKDEGLGDGKALQSYFIERTEKYLNSKGRRLIGWDEILEGGLAPNATVMSWRGMQGGIAAAQADHDVVMAPYYPVYFDALQGDARYEPKTIGYAPNPLDRVYRFEPVPEQLTQAEAAHILGAQGQAWTEWMFDSERVEYMVYPRACALAELTWTPKGQKEYMDFSRRLRVHAGRLDRLGVNYRPLDNIVALWDPDMVSTDYAELLFDMTDLLKGPGIYEVEFLYTFGAHRLDIECVELEEDGVTVARDEHFGTTGASHKDNVYRLNVPKEKEGARYMLRAQVRSDGGNDSNGRITLRKIG